MRSWQVSLVMTTRFENSNQSVSSYFESKAHIRQLRPGKVYESLWTRCLQSNNTWWGWSTSVVLSSTLFNVCLDYTIIRWKTESVPHMEMSHNRKPLSDAKRSYRIGNKISFKQELKNILLTTKSLKYSIFILRRFRQQDFCKKVKDKCWNDHSRCYNSYWTNTILKS